MAQNKALKRYRIRFHVFGPLMLALIEWVLLFDKVIDWETLLWLPTKTVDGFPFTTFPDLKTSVKLGIKEVNEELSL